MLQTIHGDSLEVLRAYPDGLFSAVVTDPPYGLSSTPDMAEVLRHWLAGDDYQHRGGGFMGKSWDSFVPGPRLWAEVLRVMRPGAHLLCFAGSRTQDLMSVALRLAGFEVRDTVMWLYSTGFPKSLAIDKAIDRARDDRPEVLEVTAWVAAARDAAGLTNRDIDAAFGFCGMAGHWTSQRTQPTVPTLEQVPELLRVLGDPEVPQRVRQLLFELNGRKGTPGADWLRREVVGVREMADTTKVSNACSLASQGFDQVPKRMVEITTAATERSKPWQGYGTALKPAYEPIIVAMRPTQGTFAQNALAHGVAGINVDACRVPLAKGDALQDGIDRGEALDTGGIDRGEALDTGGAEGSWGFKAVSSAAGLGRWPANVVLDEETGAPLGERARFYYCPKTTTEERHRGVEDFIQWEEPDQNSALAATLERLKDTFESTTTADRSCSIDSSGRWRTDRFPPDSRSTIETVSRTITALRTSNWSPTSSIRESIRDAIRTLKDAGSSPAEAAERLRKSRLDTTDAETGSLLSAAAAVCDALSEISSAASRGNFHSTVKPVDLMRWLVRMVKYPGENRVLDPFLGSGTTGIAAKLEGVSFVGIEREAAYLEIARRRIEGAR